MPYLFLYFVAAYLLLLAIPYLVIFQRLSGLSFQHPIYTLKLEQEVPDYVQQVFKGSIQELQTFGFEFSSYYQSDDMLGVRRWGVLMQQVPCRSFATLVVNALPDPANPADIAFYTFFEQGDKPNFLLMTMNALAHGIVGKIPNAIVLDEYVLTVEQQWAVHKNKLQELGGGQLAQIDTFSTFLTKLQAHETAYVDSLIQSKVLTRSRSQLSSGASSLSLELLPAVQTAFKVGRGNSKRTAILRQRARTRAATSTGEPSIEKSRMGTIRGDDSSVSSSIGSFVERPIERPIEIPIEAEVDAYHHLQQFEQGRSRRSTKLWILALSLVVFALSFTHLFPLQDLLVLIAVLFLHELGHFVAMRGFGYENTSIFFLPFFGAATSGRKDHATLSEKVWVLLAGPLPGLLLGCVLAIALSRSVNQSTLLTSTINFLVILNYLNLLPIFPLDGGRVVNLLLFSRYPWADLIFKGFTVLLIAALALLSAGDPLLVFLAIIVGLSLPNSYRSARILKQLQQTAGANQPSEDQASDRTLSTLLPRLFTAVKQAGYGAMPFNQKYNLVRSLVQLQQEPNAKWTTRLALLGFYSVSLIGGLVLSVVSLSISMRSL